jgi:hypothetical protein
MKVLSRYLQSALTLSIMVLFVAHSMTLIRIDCLYAECHYSERYVFTVMLSVIMLSDVFSDTIHKTLYNYFLSCVLTFFNCSIHVTDHEANA